MGSGQSAGRRRRSPPGRGATGPIRDRVVGSETRNARRRSPVVARRGRPRRDGDGSARPLTAGQGQGPQSLLVAHFRDSTGMVVPAERRHRRPRRARVHHRQETPAPSGSRLKLECKSQIREPRLQSTCSPPSTGTTPASPTATTPSNSAGSTRPCRGRHHGPLHRRRPAPRSQLRHRHSRRRRCRPALRLRRTRPLLHPNRTRAARVRPPLVGVAIRSPVPTWRAALVGQGRPPRRRVRQGRLPGRDDPPRHRHGSRRRPQRLHVLRVLHGRLQERRQGLGQRQLLRPSLPAPRSAPNASPPASKPTAPGRPASLTSTTAPNTSRPSSGS